MDWALREAATAFDPATLVTAVLVAIAVVCVAILARGFLIASVDEVARIWRQASPGIAGAVLGRRTALPTTPWFCTECLSHNGAVATRCYNCDARRIDAEWSALEEWTRADQQAGLARRK